MNFCKACGFRRNVLERLTGSDLYDRAKAEKAFAEAQEAGNAALAAALSVGLKTFPEQDYFILHRRDKGGKTRLSPIVGPHKNQVIQRMKATPKDEKYRSEIYICRGSERGKQLDRRAVGIISIALGHSREDTAITNYIRNL